MIYLVEGYSEVTKISQTFETYLEAKSNMNSLMELGFRTIVTPLELTRNQFGEACLQALKDYLERSDLDA